MSFQEFLKREAIKEEEQKVRSEEFWNQLQDFAQKELDSKNNEALNYAEKKWRQVQKNNVN